MMPPTLTRALSSPCTVPRENIYVPREPTRAGGDLGLPAHLESHLGLIDTGWKSETGLQVARFRNQPQAGASTFVTMGLSRHTLRMPKTREVRQELIFAAHDTFEAPSVASFLLTFGETIVSRHEALLRGEVVGPSNPIIPGVAVRAIYAAIPVIFADS